MKNSPKRITFLQSPVKRKEEEKKKLSDSDPSEDIIIYLRSTKYSVGYFDNC